MTEPDTIRSHRADPHLRPPSRRAVIRATLVAVAAALAFWVGAAAIPGGSSPVASTVTNDALLEHLQKRRAECQLEYDSAPLGSTGNAARTRARACITDVERAIAALLASPTPSSTPTGSPTPSATPSPTPTTPSPSPTAVPTPTPSPSPTAGGWPDASNTGVPPGTVLSAYTGPCTITAPVTIDAKTVNCDLDIAATVTGVTITRSQINGAISVGVAGDSGVLRLSIADSTIDAGHRLATGLSEADFDAQRIEVLGGNRGVLCAWRCKLQDSWVHGTYVDADWHASGVRAERYSTIVHNTLSCDWLIPTAQDGGCSADLTGYPDFNSIHDWTIRDNLFIANTTGAAFCAYGGSSPGKPYSSDPMTGVNIQFINNTFQHGSGGGCGAYGPIDSWNPNKAGALFSGNVWDSGEPVIP